MFMYTISEVGNLVVYEDKTEGHELSLPKENFGGFAMVGDVPEIAEEEAYINAVTHPVDGMRLCEIAANRRAKKACVLISDATRSVPTNKVAGIIVDELVAGGVPKSGITFIVGIGVHRDATEAEMRTMLGEKLWGEVSIVNHDPWHEANLKYIGDTSTGTPV